MTATPLRRKSGSTADLVLPKHLSDGFSIIHERHIDEFVQYLKMNNKTHLDFLFPDHFNRVTVAKVITHFHNSVTIASYPNFMIAYLSYLLYRNICVQPTCEFLRLFLSQDIACDTKILDVFLPLSFYTFDEQRKNLLKYLFKKFGSDFLKSFIRLIEKSQNKECLLKFLEEFIRESNIIEEDLMYIDQKAMLNNWAIQVIPKASSPHKSRSSVSDESALDILMDQIEVQPKDPGPILNQIYRNLIKYKKIPNRSIEPLMNICLRTLTTFPNDYKLTALMQTLNRYHEPASLLQLYLKQAKDQSISKEAIEICYQDFLLRAREKIILTDAPQTLAVMQDDRHEGIQQAFSWLTIWDSSYDGVEMIYNILIEDPTIEIYDDFIRIQDFTERAYLVNGLQYFANHNNSHKLDRIIENLCKMLFDESYHSKVSRSAKQLEEKMELIRDNSSNSSIRQFSETSSLSSFQIDPIES